MAEYSAFNRDLTRSHPRVKGLILWLKNREKVLEAKYNHDNRFDIWVKTHLGEQYQIEVKEDFKSEHTGNIAIEYRCRGRDSGIKSTAATHWVYILHHPFKEVESRLISIYNLRMLEVESKRDVSGGDAGSDTRMKLVPLNKFMANSTHLFYYDNTIDACPNCYLYSKMDFHECSLNRK